MADTLLGPVIQKLVDLLSEEASLLKGVHKELKSLKREVEIIEPFLRDAEAKSERREFGEATNVWLKQIREEADRIEDVVEEYLYHFGHQSTGFIGSLHKASRFVKSSKHRHEIASEIRDIEESLRKTKDLGQSLGLRPFEQGGGSSSKAENEAVDPRIGSRYVDNNELVGLDSASGELVRRLVEGESRRSVISLVGEGGIGKTMLAKKVYDDVFVKERFDCRVWITVSQSYSVNKILEIMMKKICPTATEIVGGVEDLIDALRDYLETKSYVVVFDDVWQVEFWGVIKHSLPNNIKGSRIIVTTRNTKVVDSFKENSCDVVQELKTWSRDQAWELFCKKAFYSDRFGGKCPPELEKLSRDILSKCQGLPLVIIAVAGLLSKKEKTPLEWRRVLESLDYEFRENPQLTNVSKVLSLSYRDLPYYLKPCFLYFGLFPEDYLVLEERLYNSWIAEGFVHPKGNKSLEQVAEEYLNELICRKLVTFEIGPFGYQRMCRVHDLIHETILSKIDTLAFAQIFNRNKSRFEGKNSRRLSVIDSTEDALEVVGNSRIRSAFLFNASDLNNSFVAKLFKSFKLLKVLDFKNAPLDKLPKEIGNLFLLKSLNLSGTHIEKLPKSIGKLHNLQRLQLYYTLVRELPVEINKLVNLRTLEAFCREDYENESECSDKGVKVHEGIGGLVELRKLEVIKAYPGGGTSFVKELERLKKLTYLAISNLTTEIGGLLGAAIEKMNHLEYLRLYSINEDEIFDSKSISSPPPLLCYIDLSCRLQEFPDWISKLQNLHGLVLRNSRLMDEPLKYLKNLPNLATLRLDKAYEGEELLFEDGSFRKLKRLGLESLEGLEVLKIERGALPLLKNLEIGPFPLMKEMPSDIQHLTNLESLRCVEMTKEFVSCLQPDGGGDYWKIQHIPSVQFWFTTRGMIYDWHKLGSSELLQLLHEQTN